VLPYSGRRDTIGSAAESLSFRNPYNNCCQKPEKHGRIVNEEMIKHVSENDCHDHQQQGNSQIVR